MSYLKKKMKEFMVLLSDFHIFYVILNLNLHNKIYYISIHIKIEKKYEIHSKNHGYSTIHFITTNNVLHLKKL